MVKSPKCLLCGNRPHYRSRRQSNILAEWDSRLAVALCQILELDDTFQPVFVKARFCFQCQETVYNAEFTVNAISRLQSQLGFMKDNIKGLLLSNYYRSTDSDRSMYNLILRGIVSKLGVVRNVELVEREDDTLSDDPIENVESSNEEFIIPTMPPPTPPEPPEAPRQKILDGLEKTLLESSNRKMTESETVGMNNSSRVSTDLVVTPRPETLFTYSRSRIKINPPLKISTEIFEDQLSSEDEGDGMDPGGQDVDYDSIGTPESSLDNEEDQLGQQAEVDMKANEKVEMKQKPVVLTGLQIPTESKYTCNYESCIAKHLAFTFPREVMAHLVTVHGGEGLGRLYHCPHCPHRAKDNERLRRHALVHMTKEERPKYPCTTCGKVLLDRRGMKLHVAKYCWQSSKARRNCHFCKKPFSSPDALSAHVGLHSDATPFDCVLCPTKLKHKAQLISHVRAVHIRSKKYPEGVGSFPCNFQPCRQDGSKLSEVEDMKRHLAEVHDQEGLALEHIYHCTHCGDRFRLNKELQRHLIVKHGPPQELHKGHLCSMCGKLLMTNATLRRHLRDFHSEFRQKPKCTLCTKTCDSSAQLRAHEELHSRLTPYACVICPETFITTLDLHRHIYNRHEDIPFRCPESGCEKGFQTKLRLDNHKKTVHRRPDERPHTCPQCSFSAWRQSGLKEHMRNHETEKPFICEVEGCGRSFVWKTKLANHVKVRHWVLGTMIPCKICGMEFGTKGTLKRHEVAHSDSRPFGCHLCEAKFKVKKVLKRHLASHESGGLKQSWKPLPSRLVPPSPLPPQTNHDFIPQFF